MRIPVIGDRVLFVLLAANTEGKRDPIVRPAQIVSISDYTAFGMRCNLLVTLDGDNDDQLVSMLKMHKDGWHTWATCCELSDEKEQGSFHFPSEHINKIESFTVRNDITHGRETIKAGSQGIWDQSKNLVTFSRSNVEGLHQDDLPHYDARKFINLHCARLDAPVGFEWRNAQLPLDGTENPDERTQFQDSITEREACMMGRAYINHYNTFAHLVGLPVMKVDDEDLEMPPLKRMQSVREMEEMKNTMDRFHQKHNDLNIAIDHHKDEARQIERPQKNEDSSKQLNREPEYASH